MIKKTTKYKTKIFIYFLFCFIKSVNIGVVVRRVFFFFVFFLFIWNLDDNEAKPRCKIIFFLYTKSYKWGRTKMNTFSWLWILFNENERNKLWNLRESFTNIWVNKHAHSLIHLHARRNRKWGSLAYVCVYLIWILL